MSDRTDYMLRPFLKDQDVIQDGQIRRNAACHTGAVLLLAGTQRLLICFK